VAGHTENFFTSGYFRCVLFSDHNRENQIVLV